MAISSALICDAAMREPPWFVRRLWNGEVGAEIPPPLN
jgi:hypothetical protein